ncbi:MAG: hypothetical protein NXI20_08505 [bacterium]|nr:hypothetical protein [bacterium]
MKIKNKKDVEILEERINNELGLDIRKYKNPEVVDSFVEILIFPKYVISWVIRPVLVFLLLFVAGYFIINITGFEFVLYSMFGLILFIASGVLTGLLILIWKMKSDMWGIIEYALDIMKSSVVDVNNVNSKLWSENRKEAMSLLFQGIIHIVVLPTLAEVVAGKIPFVGGLVTGLIKKILTILANKIDFEPETEEKELKEIESEDDEKKASKSIEVYSKVIDKASSGLNTVLSVTFKIVSMPLRIISFFAYLFLILLIYSIWG